MFVWVGLLTWLGLVWLLRCGCCAEVGGFSFWLFVVCLFGYLNLAFFDCLWV